MRMIMWLTVILSFGVLWLTLFFFTTQLTLYHIINQRHRAFAIVVVCISLVEYEIKVSLFPNEFWLSQ
jgi:hypothetical protein